MYQTVSLFQVLLHPYFFQAERSCSAVKSLQGCQHASPLQRQVLVRPKRPSWQTRIVRQGFRSDSRHRRKSRPSHVSPLSVHHPRPLVQGVEGSEVDEKIG